MAVLTDKEARIKINQFANGDFTRYEEEQFVLDLYESLMEALVDNKLLHHQLDLAEKYIINKKDY